MTLPLPPPEILAKAGECIINKQGWVCGPREVNPPLDVESDPWAGRENTPEAWSPARFGQATEPGGFCGPSHCGIALSTPQDIVITIHPDGSISIERKDVNP